MVAEKYYQLIADIGADDALDRIIEQVNDEVIAWTNEYHSHGNKGAELSDSDVTAIVANRYARHVLRNQP